MIAIESNPNVALNNAREEARQSMITTETINKLRTGKRPINYDHSQEFESNGTGLLVRLAKLVGVTEDELAKELGVNKPKARRPDRPLARCKCGKRYAVQDSSCFEEQDTCPACRDEEAAPARAEVHAREKVAIEAQKEALEKNNQIAKDEEDARIAKIAHAVVEASK